MFPTAFLSARLAQPLHTPLPGITAHRAFVPDIPDAASRLKGAPPDAKQSAVVVPIIERADGVAEVLLTVRTEQLRNHKGQISFPGGRVDSGETIVQGALRELNEEVGIEPHNVVVLGSLTSLFIPPSYSVVYPIVALVREPQEYITSEAEVREVFTVELQTLMLPETKTMKPMNLYGIPVQVPIFNVHPVVPLWGATAMILNELLSLLHEAGYSA